MNRFLIFITRSPYDSLNGQTALSFCEAAAAMGHQIEQIFFYQEGVQHANADIQPGSGEGAMLQRWTVFSKQTKTPLNVCVTASVKRGVLSDDDANTFGRNSNIQDGFCAVGMADYFSALNTSATGNDSSPICIQF